MVLTASQAHLAHLAHLAHMAKIGAAPTTPARPAPNPAHTGGLPERPPARPGTSPAPATTTPAGNASLPGSGLIPNDTRNAQAMLTALFDGYGLGSLSGKILEYLQNGYSQDAITVMLQQSDEYKARFAGNEIRRKNGLGVLAPREYLAVEASYRQILSSAGLPAGFYDQHSDFTNWIGSDVAPQEIKERVDMATAATTMADNPYKQALSQMGFQQGDMVAAFLDQKRALPLLHKQATTAEIGSEALRQGMAFDPNRAEQFALQGVNRNQAAQAYSQIGQFLPDASKLGQIYGDAYTQQTAEDELLGGSATAAKKRKTLGEKETAQFAGTGGVGKSSLGTYQSGSF